MHHNIYSPFQSTMQWSCYSFLLVQLFKCSLNSKIIYPSTPTFLFPVPFFFKGRTKSMTFPTISDGNILKNGYIAWNWECTQESWICSRHVIMVILNALSMQNADEHFPLRALKCFNIFTRPETSATNNRQRERDNRIKDGILDLVCHFSILLLTLVKLS